MCAFEQEVITQVPNTAYIEYGILLLFIFKI